MTLRTQQAHEFPVNEYHYRGFENILKWFSVGLIVVYCQTCTLALLSASLGKDELI